jgi:branched-chain amino acid aminotransferase
VSLLVYIDGEYVPQEEAKISVYDHGFLYGDGVFEGIRAYHGRVFKLDEHINRLFRSAKAIMLEIPLTRDEVKAAVLGSLKRNGLSDGYVRLIVTRGRGDLGLDPRKCLGGPSVVIIADHIALYPKEMYEKGLEVVTVATRRNLPEAINPAIKSLNYLNNIVAKLEVIRAHLLEGIMLNHQGYVAEATGDNIFIYRQNRLVTPPLSVGILQGIRRDTVIDLAQEAGIAVVEEVFNQYDLYNAEECFLTGTAAEIVPVVKVDGRVIGTGEPGPITRDLTTRFRQLVATTGVPIE